MFKLSRSKTFQVCSLVFIFGIAISSFLPVSIRQFSLYFFAIFIFSLVASILFWRTKLAIFLLIISSLFFGFWRYSLSLPVLSPDYVYYYNERKIDLVGQVIEARTKGKIQKIKIDKIRGFKGKVLVITNLYPRYYYGDILRLECHLKPPQSFKNFDYPRFLAQDNIYSLCYYPEISFLGQNKNSIYFYLNKFKQKLSKIINYNLGEPESSLVNAIILGNKDNIPKFWREKFFCIGIGHILAISGMHIGILATILMFVFIELGLWRKTAFWLSSLFIFLYIILIGAPASAVRAGVMGFLVLLALSYGRLRNITNSLLLALLILLLINPKSLRDDVGLQLSFLAVLGIVYFYPFFNKILEDKIKHWRILDFFWKIFCISLAVQITIWPISLFYFSRISLISILSNLFVVGALPIIISLVLAAFLFYIVLPQMSSLLFLVVKFLLDYIMAVSDLFYKMPYACIGGSINLFFMFAYYLILFIIILKLKKASLS